jgi:hypothetical protein
MKTPKTSKKALPVLPSALLLSLTTRRAGKMKHRTAARGGAKNNQAAFRAGEY